MSAAINTVPSQTRWKTNGYLFTNESLAEVRWVASSWTGQQILEEIVRLVNTRDYRLDKEGRKHGGRTALVLTSELLSDIRCEIRMGQIALAELLDTSHENTPDYLPAVRRVSREEAIAEGLVSVKDAGRKRDDYMYEPLYGNWPELARRNREAWEAERAERAMRRAQAALEPPPPVPSVVHVPENQPLVLMPGARSRPVRLPDSVRKAFSDGLAFVPDSRLDQAMSLTFSVGDVITFVVSNVSEGTQSIAYPTVEEETGGTQCIAHPLGLDIDRFLGPVYDEFVDVAGDPYTPELGARVAAKLQKCPIDTPEGACYRRTLSSQLSFKNRPRVVLPGFFVYCAEMAYRDWIQERANPNPRRRQAPAPRRDEGMTPRQAHNFLEAEKHGEHVDADLLAEARHVLAKEEVPC